MNRYAQKVPKYESYKLMLQASEYWTSNPDKVEKLLLKSFEADTSHYTAIARLCTFYSNSGRYDQIDSLVKFLDVRTDNLTTWENLQLNRDKARLKFNTDEELKFALQQLAIDSSIDQHNIALILHGDNRLEEALTMYQNELKRNPPGKTERSQYVLSKIVSILNRLGRYQETLTIIDDLKCPPKHGLVIWEQFGALYHLKEWDKIDTALHFYEQLGSQSTFQSQLAILSILYINKNSKLESYINQAKQKNLNIQLPYHILWLKAQLEFILGNFDESINNFSNTSSITRFDLSQLAVMEYAGYINQARALEEDYLKEKVYYDQPYYYYYALGQYYIAQGDKAKSTEYLKKAINSGMRFLPETFKNDLFLRDLIGYEPYEELVRPQ